MTNEQKADEISIKFFFNSNHFDCCMEMAEWKDEQHKQEKQQWIDKACEWLKANADEWIASYSNIFIDNFKKAMK